MRLFLFLLLCSFGCLAHEHNSTPRFFVGELGSSWEFESDHLPVGVTVEGVHIACWNILDTDYIEWIEGNGQGLKESAILRDNLPDGEITLRDRKVLAQVHGLLNHQTHPRGILALEEVGKNFFQVLKAELPAHIEVVTTFADDLAHGDLFLYDSRLFDFVSLVSDYYTGNRGSTWMILTLQEKKTGKLFACMQSHVPGGPPSEHCRKELALSCEKHFNPAAITLIMGDQNRSPDYFQKDLEERGLSSLHPLRILYPTHVNTLMEASWIDNIFINTEEAVHIASPEELLPEMKEPIEAMWNHFPLIEEMRQISQKVAETQNEAAIALYEKLAEDTRLRYLETEGGFDLILTLQALQFSSGFGQN